MRRRLTMAMLVVAVLAGRATAGPQLDAAREAKAMLDYARALTLAGEALRSGDHDAAGLVEIYGLAGEVAAGLDRADEAESWFRKLLALEPSSTLPPGTSPKITAPFDAARAFIEARGPLSVRAEEPAGAAVLVVDRDPVDLVAGARVYLQRADGTLFVLEGRGDDRIAVQLPPNVVGNRIAAIDEYGNELATLDLSPRSLTDEVVRPGRPGGAWWLAAAVTAASLGAGVYFALDTRTAEDDLAALNDRSGMGESIDANEAHALVKRGRRSAVLANVGLAAAGVGAAITGWLLYRRFTAPEQRLAVTPSVGLDRAGVAVRLRF